MTLNSYLKDLLGGSSLEVKIVNDNAVTSSEETRMIRSCSWVAQRRNKPSSSRWDGLERRKSDSALGLPQRRSSYDSDELWPSSNELMVAGDDEGETSEDSTKKERRRNKPEPLVRAFSDHAGKRKGSSSEKRSIRQTMKTLHKLRASSKSKQKGDKKIRDILGSMAPPLRPIRRSSDDETTLSEKRIPASPKDLVMSGPSTIEFPESLRELPYESS